MSGQGRTCDIPEVQRVSRGAEGEQIATRRLCSRRRRWMQTKQANKAMDGRAGASVSVEWCRGCGYVIKSGPGCVRVELLQ